MELKRDFKNSLLKRREVILEIRSESNPGREGAKKAVAEKLKADEGLIAVRKVEGNFGSDKFVIEAFVYDSKENLDRIEPKKKEKKTNG